MSVSEFNASVFVSEQLSRQLVNTSQDLAYRCVAACAKHYNFDAEEAYRLLGLAMIRVERKTAVKEKTAKVAKVSAPKSAFPLPYNGEFNDAYCYALRQNNGLYTQCSGLRKGDAQFCKSCATTMQKTGADVPEYGTIQMRQAVDIFDYVDPKGRKPVAYTKIMKKYKFTQEQALEEAGKFNITINPEHFVVAEESKRGRPKTEKEPKVKGAKGRPKKSNKVLQIEGDDEEDLFATLVANANEESNDEMVIIAKTDAKKKSSKSEEEKEAERLALAKQKEAEKKAKRLAAEQAKAEREAKLLAEKLEREAKKEAERLAREAKKAEEEAAKEAKRLALEQAKKEKEAKLAAEKAEKEAAKATKSKKAPESKEEVEDEEPDVVKKIEFEGKKYLKSKKTGIVYDYNEYVKNGEQVVVGKWNETSNKIEFTDAEEEEEEYDI